MMLEPVMIMAAMVLPGAFASYAPTNRAELVSSIRDVYGACIANPLGPASQPISEWDVSAVDDMNQLFMSCSSFNGDISSWDTSSVTNFQEMFKEAAAFNQDISSWDVSKGTQFMDMFALATAFDMAYTASWDTAASVDGGLHNQPCPDLSDAAVPNEGNLTTRCPDYVHPACSLIASNHIDGTVDAFGVGYISLNVLDKTLDLYIYESSGQRVANQSLVMNCDGLNIVTEAFTVDMPESTDQCAGIGEIMYSEHTIAINEVFGNAGLTQNAQGDFEATYKPKCILNLDTYPISTTELEYTVLINNETDISITTTAAADELGVADIDDVDMSAVVEVVLDNPNIVFTDGEVVVLDFNLENTALGALAGVDQSIFQISDITDLNVVIGTNDAYDDTQLVAYKEIDSDKGRKVTFIVPSDAYTSSTQNVTITGKAVISLYSAARRRSVRRSIDFSTYANGGTAAFSIDAIVGPREQNTCSSGYVAAAMSITAIAASGFVAASF